MKNLTVFAQNKAVPDGKFNKSNRVKTIDAFSCVFVLHLVPIITFSLIVLYYYYLNVV